MYWFLFCLKHMFDCAKVIDMNKKSYKYDLLIIGSILLVIIAAWLIFHITHDTEGDGTVVVICDGKEIASYPLAEDAIVSLGIGDTNADYNLLQIKDGYADIIDANCPDGLCVSQRAIHANGESLICLPHQLVILIQSEKESGLDAVTN